MKQKRLRTIGPEPDFGFTAWQQREQEILLVLEVAIERALANPRLSAYVINGGIAKASRRGPAVRDPDELAESILRPGDIGVVSIGEGIT